MLECPCAKSGLLFNTFLPNCLLFRYHPFWHSINSHRNWHCLATRCHERRTAAAFGRRQNRIGWRFWEYSPLTVTTPCAQRDQQPNLCQFLQNYPHCASRVGVPFWEQAFTTPWIQSLAFSHHNKKGLIWTSLSTFSVLMSVGPRRQVTRCQSFVSW